ncbi:MAG: hypothetical protein QOF73_4241, partial [Thermomicrobiales bacterium]|nr:hypothetical protein [Thermomicrobiales bacterium]
MTPATPLKLLLLEDRPEDAELTLHALRRGGYASIGPRVDSEAGYLVALSPDLDVVLADYNLPQFDAPRALQHLRECGFDVPFIVVSGT